MVTKTTPAVDALRDAIMNLPDNWKNADLSSITHAAIRAYEVGHREARQAAAALVVASAPTATATNDGFYRDVIAQVCEGWNISPDLRKMLEAALYSPPATIAAPESTPEELLLEIAHYAAHCIANDDAAADTCMGKIKLMLGLARLSQQVPSPTDLSKRMRLLTADSRSVAVQVPLIDINAMCDEIERYYGGMIAWKRTAEKDWRKEVMPAVTSAVEHPQVKQARERMDAAKAKVDAKTYGEPGWHAAERAHGDAIVAYGEAVKNHGGEFENAPVQAQPVGGERSKLMPSELPDATAIDAAWEINRKTNKNTVTPALVQQCYSAAYYVHRTP